MDFDAAEEPKWKLVERVVAMLEKTITPDAEVQHNVQLPDITTGHLRQCDVVIRYGKPPRQTLAIAEVQTRKSPVEISHLQGWWEKMLSVGAQHLVIVSALDYPQSVKDDVAKKRGPAVKLLRLRQLEKGNWPFGILDEQFTFTIGKSLLQGLNIQTEGKSLFTNNLEVKNGDQVFWREGGDRLLSALDLMNECINQQPGLSMFLAGKHEVTCALKPGRRLWLEVAGLKQAIQRLELVIQIEVHSTKIPVTISAYEQLNHNGVLAWAAMAGGRVEDRDVQLRLIFSPQEDGTFLVARWEVKEGQENVEGWFTFTPVEEASSAP